MGQYIYQFTPVSRRHLKRLDIKMQKRIIKKLDYFCEENPLWYARKLTDPGLGNYRLRIGDYRVVFDLEERNKILILVVKHRKDIYK